MTSNTFCFSTVEDEFDLASQELIGDLTGVGNRSRQPVELGHDKRVAEKHWAMVSLYTVHYNFCRIHKTFRVTPAMEIGLTDTAHDLEWIVGLIDARAPTPKRPGPKPGTRYAKRRRPPRAGKGDDRR